jgi:hypothetical protein
MDAFLLLILLGSVWKISKAFLTGSAGERFIAIHLGIVLVCLYNSFHSVCHHTNCLRPSPTTFGAFIVAFVPRFLLACLAIIWHLQMIAYEQKRVAAVRVRNGNAVRVRNGNEEEKDDD